MFQGEWQLDRDGFAWDSIPAESVVKIESCCNLILAQASKSFGVRNVLIQSEDLRIQVDRLLLPIASKHLNSDAFIVRSTLFDKPAEANWSVPWHQVVTIEVEDRHEVAGFSPWSVKDGLLSVQPPQGVLEKMLTLRLHLDDTDEDNGALLVNPGTHVLGKLRIEEIMPTNPISCNCVAGDVLLMRPLLFHASNRSKSTKSRRVLHLDFAYEPLPAPLMWGRI